MRGLQLTALGVFLLLGCTVPQARAAAALDDLTGPWQLLVDDYPVLFKTNVVRTYHAFQKYANNPVVVADRPWEEMVYIYGTVLPNETRTGYRMWYQTLRPSDESNEGSLQLYATSTNGIHWTKPILNLRSWHGSTANNMFFIRSTLNGIVSVMHTPWESDPGRAYQFMNFDEPGYWAAWSPDGIHVTDSPTNPALPGGSDVGQFWWDPHKQLFRGYVKNAWYDWNGRKRRAVALTTTTNIASWPQESLILWPDAYDDRWIIPGSVQRTHFYGLSAFAYESMYLGFLWIFRATELDGEMPGYLIGPCFVELISSHDGVHWTRQEAPRPPILPLGPSGAWDDGMIFTARAPIVEGDFLKLWYGGCDQEHGMPLNITSGSIGLATLRKDGFASLDAAGTATGIILTKPLTSVGGALLVNYRAAGGSLKVEVLDEHNNVLPGYTQADCLALTGDSVAQAVAWTAHNELPANAPSISLRFILENASLYSFMAGESSALADVPTIIQQPDNQIVVPGGSASFTVVASAINPLSYRWQQNQVNLADGGHYSGCATPTLTITGADVADAALYRCVVTNLYGSVVSSPATLLVATNALGSVTLTSIPTLSGDTNNEARGMTPDGRFVAGLSGTGKGFLYDSASNTVVRPISSDGTAAGILTGVAYRTDSNQVPPRKQLVVSGLAANNNRFTTWMTANGGLSWGNRVQYPGGPKLPTVAVANSLAGTSSDVFYAVWTDEGTGDSDNWGLRVGRFSGPWPATPKWAQKDAAKPSTLQVNGVSSNGRGVGWRRDGTTGTYVNYIADWIDATGPVLWSSRGLDGTTAGQAYAVSADGTVVFGLSPPAVGGVTHNYGYKAVFDATMPGMAAQLSTGQLPNFPDTGGPTSLAIPYGCTADGRYAVGANYRGGIEKAVLWDTSGSNPTNWTVTDLTEVVAASGSSGIFARLARAHSIGTSAAGGLVIGGVGLTTNTPARTRAFLMTFVPPAAPVIPRPTVTISGSYTAGLTFSFPTIANPVVMYYLEYTTNLTPPIAWTAIGSTQGTGTHAILTDPNPTAVPRFYRIRVQ